MNSIPERIDPGKSATYLMKVATATYPLARMAVPFRLDRGMNHDVARTVGSMTEFNVVRVKNCAPGPQRPNTEGVKG